jgi:RNA polymerase sigma-70 factor (ECF subfamily)
LSETQRLERDVAHLVPPAQAGDAAAREALLARCHPTVFRWALVQVGDADEAEDVAQEALVRLDAGLGGFAGKSLFATWLYRVTRNVALEWGRRAARTLRLRTALARGPDDDPAMADPADGVHADAVSALVRALLDDLPPRQREVFYLADLEELAPVDIAQRLGLEPATVRVHLLRARRALRARILSEHPAIAEEYRP